MRSIERYLLAWILGALSVGALLVSLAAYLVTLEEMHEVFDADLKNVAEAVANAYLPPNPGEAASGVPPARTDEPDDSEIVTLKWTARGQRVHSSDTRVKVPFMRSEGLSRPIVEGESWIVYTSIRPEGVGQAAQRLSARRQMAGESAVQILAPLIGLALVVVGLLVFGLRRGLRPLDGTARDIAVRSARSLEPIGVDGIPREITPLVASINGLMSRLAASFSAQRRFLADAAHELRTPVTALRLQLQLLKGSQDENERRQAMLALEAGIDRSQRLVEQLLQVARTEPDAEATRREPVDLGQLVRSVVATLSIKADARRLDLGAKVEGLVVIRGDADQLTVLLNNLVENALRYTPAGGVVDVEARIGDDGAMVSVSDNGPGIPEAERERAFDRFYRGEEAHAQSTEPAGSGLGLAIVRAIAERHGARVSLCTPASGKGLEVQVVFAGAG